MGSRTLASDADTAALGSALAATLPRPFAGWLLLLRGELGSGKSTLARAILRERGHEGAVPSPTYTLVEPYAVPDGNIYHIDLYRLNGLEELDYLGWQDFRDGLQLVEWPERAPELGARADICIHLDYAARGRAVTLKAVSDRAASVVERALLGLDRVLN
jgi:tRNA threonylcarbamoyladenosine biosynthesis protein TsaE